nr:hypothetical protein [Neobacillus sp. Marseille-Q6967]
MGYIIENANILKETQLTKCSLLINDTIITARESQLNRYKLMKMDMDAYIMTPSFVLFDPNIPLKTSFRDLRHYLMGHFLMKGSTTLLTYVTVSYESELCEKIRQTKTALISSPIDFVLAVKIPARLLTPSFIRKCKKEKIPAIFIEADNIHDLENLPWGWIREAMFPYNQPLIPIISTQLKKEAKGVLSKWKAIMEKEKLPAIFEELKEHEPLSVPTLNKIGLYREKTSLLHGSELSYNLYFKGREIKNVDEVNLFLYHGDRLAVTVHKGKVVRAGKEVLIKPGNGEHVKVQTPSYFSF